MLAFVLAFAAHAAECGPNGCPVPPTVPDDGTARPSGAIPALDREAHAEVRTATFALG